MVEVVEKPIDVSARIDNRGTKARGPYQYFISVSINNIARWHEAGRWPRPERSSSANCNTGC